LEKGSLGTIFLGVGWGGDGPMVMWPFFQKGCKFLGTFIGTGVPIEGSIFEYAIFICASFAQ